MGSDGGEQVVRRARSVFGENTMTKLMARLSHRDLAQIGDARRDVAAEHVDGHGVADLHAESLGDLGLE